MTAVSSDDYYQANISREKEYTRIGYAYPVKAGEVVHDLQKSVSGACGVRTTMVAPEDGYVITTYPDKEFLTLAEFKEKKIPAGKLKLPLAKKSLSAEGISDVAPVQDGETVSYKTPSGGTAEWTVPDHFVHFRKKGRDGYSYMADHELSAIFNCASLKLPPQEYLVVADKNAAPVKGIILDKETAFEEPDGQPSFAAPAGFLLSPSKDSPDGYILAPPAYLNLNLRLPEKPKTATQSKPKI